MPVVLHVSCCISKSVELVLFQRQQMETMFIFYSRHRETIAGKAVNMQNIKYYVTSNSWEGGHTLVIHDDSAGLKMNHTAEQSATGLSCECCFMVYCTHMSGLCWTVDPLG